VEGITMAKVREKIEDVEKKDQPKKTTKEKKTIVITAKYKGQKSKSGTYFPYDIQPNFYGIVGGIYIPIDKDVPDVIEIQTE
jgi:hypothetical protein